MTINRVYYEPNRGRRSQPAPRRDLHRFNTGPIEGRVEYQIFTNEYFSAADVKLYFGDIWVDDITHLDFRLEEQVLPIYGYNSFTYDVVARGKRAVMGSFSTNFTSVGFLQQVIEHADAIHHAIQEGTVSGLVKPEYYKEYKLTDILQKLGKSSFDEIADEYEKAIWGTGSDNNERLAYADQPWFKSMPFGFDIRVHYGAVSETVEQRRNSFYQDKSWKPNLTVETINGVQLTGMSKMGIATSAEGKPIQEAYEFFARDLNGKRNV